MLRTVSTLHPSGRVSARDLLAYAAPATGVAFHLFFIQFYFLKFATDVLLAAPAVIGLLMGLSRVWDAVSDPLVGYWSDGTRSRLGRRRLGWRLCLRQQLVCLRGCRSRHEAESQRQHADSAHDALPHLMKR